MFDPCSLLFSIARLVSRFFIHCFGLVFNMVYRLLSAHRLSSLLTVIKISHARQNTAAAAEAMRAREVVAREFPEGSKANGGGGNTKRTGFWMRDPAMGNWIPEDHFGETDIAELRQKLHSTKK